MACFLLMFGQYCVVCDRRWQEDHAVPRTVRRMAQGDAQSCRAVFVFVLSCVECRLAVRVERLETGGVAEE